MPRPKSKGLNRRSDNTLSHGRLDRQLKITKTPLVSAFAPLKPNWRAYIFYVDQAAKSGDEKMQAVMAAFGKLSRYEQTHYVNPEWLCECAGILPRDLLGSIVPLIYDAGHFESTITKAAARPDVLAKTAKEALKAGAEHFKDRELFLKVTNDVPIRQGSVTNIAAVGSTGSLVGHKGGLPALPSAGQEIMGMDASEGEDNE